MMTKRQIDNRVSSLRRECGFWFKWLFSLFFFLEFWIPLVFGEAKHVARKKKTTINKQQPKTRTKTVPQVIITVAVFFFSSFFFFFYVSLLFLVISAAAQSFKYSNVMSLFLFYSSSLLLHCHSEKTLRVNEIRRHTQNTYAPSIIYMHNISFYVQRINN